MGRVTARVPAYRLDTSPDAPAEQAVVSRPDTLAVEEPMEIRVDGTPLSVTMRTPGNDFDLALGNLFTEGLIAGAGEVAQIMHCQDVDESGAPTYNVVDLTMAPGVGPLAASAARSFVTTSACGVCGKASIEAIAVRSRYDVAADTASWQAELVASLPQRLRSRQKVFDRTGGVHAAGLFDAQGSAVYVREDVGRHNAVDKVIGAALRDGLLPLRAHALVVSGRASFELTQKALMAGIPMLVAVSAPSSLAAQLAAERGLTLIGFARAPRLTVYTCAHRVTGAYAKRSDTANLGQSAPKSPREAHIQQG